MYSGQYADDCIMHASSMSSSNALSPLEKSLHKITFFFFAENE